MAEIAYTFERTKNGDTIVKWESATEADTFKTLEIATNVRELTYQISGTFGAGGDIDVTGSNDGTTFVELLDVQGAAARVTANSVETLDSAPRYIKPAVVGGTGLSIDVFLLIRRG